MKTTDFSLSKIGSIQKKLLFIYLIWVIVFVGTACFMVLEAKGLGLILQENNADSGLLVNQVLLLGLISLVGMSLVFFFLTRKILRPLRTLLQTTNELTSENLKVRAEVMADDEIGQLALAFNRMDTTLDETRASKTLLKQNEERFRKIFFHSNEAIFLINAEQDKIKEANASACNMLGFTRETLLSKTCSDIYPDDMPALQTFFDGVNENGNGWRDELLCRTKNGETLSTEVSASTIDINGTACINALVRDLSNQKKSGKWLGVDSTVMKSTQEGIIVTDAERNIQGINPAFTRVTGYTKKEVIGKNARILKSGLQDPTFYKKMWMAIDEKGAWKGEIWNRRKNGQIYPEGLAISAIKNQQGEVSITLPSSPILSRHTHRASEPVSFPGSSQTCNRPGWTKTPTACSAFSRPGRIECHS